MTDVLLDTNAYAAFKAGRSLAVEIVRRARTIGVAAVVRGELLGGFAFGSQEATSRRELFEFERSARVAHLPVDAATAEQYALVYASLRRKGRPIPTNDLWIAALALQHRYALFSHDAHFQEVEGLIVGQTPEELGL